MSITEQSSRNQSRILFIKNVSYQTTGSDLYDLFGKYGAIRQIRLGDDQAKKTKGTAFVVYEEFIDAKHALDHLNGYHLHDRYLVVLYHIPARQQARDLARREADLEALKQRHNIKDDD